MIKWPKVHKSLAYKNNGIHSKEPIQAYTKLMDIQSANIISQYTLPAFLNQLQLLSTKSKHLDQHDRIILYVMILQNMANKQQVFAEQKQLITWLQADTAGFVAFSQALIKQTNDQQLIIQYHAYQQHYTQKCQAISLHKQIQDVLSKFIKFNQNSRSLRQMYIIASQFCNTRIFGYTDDCLLIPGMDLFNYDPSCDCQAVELITYDTEQQYHQIIQGIRAKQIVSRQEQLCTKFNHVSMHDETNRLQQIIANITKPQQQQFSQQQTQLQKQKSVKTPGKNLIKKTKRYLSIVSVQQIQENKQIYLQYGNLCNYKLLRHYGYSVRNNPYDYVLLYMSNWHQNINNHKQKNQKIFFSSVQRSTTKYKLYRNKINSNIIMHWALIRSHNLYTYEGLKQCVMEQLQQLQRYRPPRIVQHELIREQRGYKYVKIYQQQQNYIYTNQIMLLKQLLIQLKGIMYDQQTIQEYIVENNQQITTRIIQSSDFIIKSKKIQQNVNVIGNTLFLDEFNNKVQQINAKQRIQMELDQQSDQQGFY